MRYPQPYPRPAISVETLSDQKREVLLAAAVDDAALGEIVGGHFDRHLVASQNTNVVFTHLAGNMRGHDVAGLEFDAKRRIGQGLNDLALELDCLFF